MRRGVVALVLLSVLGGSAGALAADPPLLPDRVTIAGIAVGGLSPDVALSLVQTAYEAPLTIFVAGRPYRTTPAELGATADLRAAVDRALQAGPGAAVPLPVTVQRPRVRAFVAELARDVDRPAVDARLVLRDLQPAFVRSRAGRALDRAASETAIVAALQTTSRVPIVLTLADVAPEVAEQAFGTVVVIRRGSERLYLYRRTKLEATFPVGVATGRFRTPLGRFTIVSRWRKPWYYPRRQGAKAVPPGPGNPLGLSWLGLSARGVGIHVAPDAAAFGYSISHGCVRVTPPHADLLFRRVEVGTPVFIVSA